jgi:hypothetical protein
MNDLADAYWREWEYGVDRCFMKYRLWCLGHNFDVVASIMAMASLSWSKGFDAGIAIADFSNRPTPRSNPKYPEPLQVRSYPTD